jgi:3-methyladenine DNA glycosylase/8-oxoguanine DNA glycosylase
MGPSDPTLRVAGNALAMCLRTPEGPITLEAAHSPERLDLRLWGPGSEWLEPRLPKMVGIDDRPDLFRPSHPVVREIHRRLGGAHLPRLPRVFDRIIQVVALQLVKSSEGYRAWKRIVQEFGEAAPGPQGLVLPPSPETVARLPDSALVAHGVPHKQARTMLRLAGAAGELEAEGEKGTEELTEALSRIRGIGPWTLGYVRGTALGDADAVLPGDYNLPRSIGWVLAGERYADDARMLELLEPFRGHRFRVVKLIWANGVRAPRTRPRRPNRPLGRLGRG